MPLPIQQLKRIYEAADEVKATWDEHTLYDEMRGFTCREAEALAYLFRTVGLYDLADSLIHNHGIGDDDPDDDHHEIWQREQEAMK